MTLINTPYFKKPDPKNIWKDFSALNSYALSLSARYQGIYSVRLNSMPFAYITYWITLIQDNSRISQF